MQKTITPEEATVLESRMFAEVNTVNTVKCANNLAYKLGQVQKSIDNFQTRKGRHELDVHTRRIITASLKAKMKSARESAESLSREIQEMENKLVEAEKDYWV